MTQIRPLSTAPTSLDTRERLLRSAIQIFAERGYAGGTIRDICRRAQANLASVHYYFGDKQGLYVAIFDQVSSLFRERRARYLPAEAPAAERLRVYIQVALEEILGFKGETGASADLSAIYLAEMAHPTEILDQIVALHIKPNNDELLSIVADLLELDRKAPLVTDAASSISGQILRYFLARPLISRLNPGQQPPEERVDELVERVWCFSLGGIQALQSLAKGTGANQSQ